MAGKVKDAPKHHELINQLVSLPPKERVEVIVAAIQREDEARESFLTIPPSVPQAPLHTSPSGTPPSSPEAALPVEFLKSEDVPGVIKPPGVEGVEYVMHPQVGMPVLRQINQPIYDKLIVADDGRVNVNLFDNCNTFPDGRPKTEHDCNLTMNGCLGYPNELDLHYIDLVFEKFCHPTDLQRVLKGLSFKWIRGQSVPWMRLTLSGFDPFLRGEISGLSEEKAEKQLAKAAENGVWTHYRVNVRTPDGKPQKIASTESFRVRVEGSLGELYGPVHVKVLLQGTFYAAI